MCICWYSVSGTPGIASAHHVAVWRCDVEGLGLNEPSCPGPAVAQPSVWCTEHPDAFEITVISHCFHGGTAHIICSRRMLGSVACLAASSPQSRSYLHMCATSCAALPAMHQPAAQQGQVLAHAQPEKLQNHTSHMTVDVASLAWSALYHRWDYQSSHRINYGRRACSHSCIMF